MKPKFIATRDFTDSGSEREFKAGPIPDDVGAGVLGNYLAAGLIREANDSDKIAADPAKAADETPLAAKTSPRRSTAKRSTTKSTASKLN